MKKFKNIFNAFVLTFVVFGIALCGVNLLHHKDGTLPQIEAAEIHDKIENDLPEYFAATPNEKMIPSKTINESLYLMNSGAELSFSITNGYISDGAGNQNPAFIPDTSTANQDASGQYLIYYYFEFQNNLALIYNATNTEIEIDNIAEEPNLLQSVDISNFVTTPENGFEIDKYPLLPVDFAMTLSLSADKSLETPATATVGEGENKHKVTVNKEGCYTLVMPHNYYLTNDGGKTWVDGTAYILYSFMIFEADTYLDESTLAPNATVDNFVKKTYLEEQINVNYSMYYFYNYSASTDTNTSPLPKLSYNPQLYDITIDYIDISDNRTQATFRLQYQNDSYNIAVFDENDNQLQQSPFIYNYDGERLASITFDNLGTYDITYTFIYTEKSKTFALPMTTRKQRFYMYGIQSYYTTDERDEVTQETISKELKHVLPEQSAFENSADITSKVSAALTAKNQPSNVTIQPSQTSQSAYTLAAESISFINSKFDSQNAIEPVSTNQPPVKFRKNASVKGLTRNSKYYKVEKTDDGKYKLVAKIDGEYQDVSQDNDSSVANYMGENLREPGTYILVAIYQFDDFTSSTGSPQTLFYHYQIFFFTITNTSPYASIYALTPNDLPEVGFTSKKLYTGDYTNKDVVIVDESSSSEYDADVTITLRAQDYANRNADFFSPSKVNIKNLREQDGFTYWENLGDIAGDEFNGKKGLYIDATSPYASRIVNALFTVSVQQGSSESTKATESNFVIDTNPVGDIRATAVTNASNSTFTKTPNSYIPGNKSNESLIFSWEEKASKAQTHGYFKFYPIKDYQFYFNGSEADARNARLISKLLDHGMVAVNNSLNVSTDKIGWNSYENTIQFADATTIADNYVRSAPGLYVFEVYDDAGNVNFGAYLIDNTTPLFIKSLFDIENQGYNYSILPTTETISISNEINNRLSIMWGSKKGIIIKNYPNSVSSDFYKNYYQIDKQKDLTTLGENNPLYKVLNSFFNENSLSIGDVTDVNQDGSSYNSQYLAINIVERAMIAEKVDTSTNKDYHSYIGNQYRIYYFQGENASNTESGVFTEINEGSYKFLIRDESNTKVSVSHSDTSFTSAPSGFATVVISSDSSQLKFLINNDQENGLITPDGFSISGNFYAAKDKDGADTLIKNSTDNYQTLSDKKYKYQYFEPVKTEQPIVLSYIPYANDGNKIQTLRVEYYAFVKVSQDFYMYGNSALKNQFNFEGNEEENDSFKAKAYYYTLSDTCTNTYLLNVNAEQGQVLTHTLTFSDDNKAAPGKYVITRTYENSADGEGNKFDFHERILTLIVDRFNVISKEEQISNDDGKKSLESIVGGDIAISMYSGSNQQNFTLSFPNYDRETGLNQGLLYTESDFSSGNSAVPIFDTDKSPVTVNIPQYKYTTHNQYLFDTNSYSVQTNNNLSYYGGDVQKVQEGNNQYSVYTEIVRDENGQIDKERSLRLKNADGKTYMTEFEANELVNSIKSRASISVYKLYATITYTQNGQAPQYYKTKINGDDNATNGYLKFYRVESLGDDVTSNSTYITNFTSAGAYEVAVYQASSQANIDSQTSFKNLYKFAFNILENKPIFDIVTTDWNVLSEEINNTYYTNHKIIRVRWKESTSEFLAKVDKNDIKYSINGGTFIDYIDPITSADNQTYYFDFDLSNIWNKDNFITFRLHFEGLPNNYTDKTVRIDYTAPRQTLNGLMSKVENSTGIFTTLYQQKYMRSLYQADKVDPEDTSSWTSVDLESNLDKISYSYLNETERFKFYFYTVDRSFFESAWATLNANKADRTQAQHLYVRSLSVGYENENFDPLENYVPARAGFDTSMYTDLLQNNEFDASIISNNNLNKFDVGTYYEFVEMDLAGNMSVYLVYYLHNLSPEANAVVYTNKTTEDGEQEVVSNQDIKNDNFNLFSNSDFTLKSLNYNADKWATYKVSIKTSRNETQETTFLSSPYALKVGGEDENSAYYLYKATLNANGDYDFTPVNIESIFASVVSSNLKHSIQISDRVTGEVKTMYVSVMDGSLNTYKDSQTSSLRIDVPANYNSNDTAYIYPVHIKIDQYFNGGWNKPLYDSSSANPTVWEPDESGLVIFNYAAGQLQITINASDESTKFRYMITDNFGNVTTVIQLVKEEIITNEIRVSDGSRYWQINEPDQIPNVTYLASNSMAFYYNSLIYNARVVQWYENGLFGEENNKIVIGNEVTPSNQYNSDIKFFELTAPRTENFNSVYVIELSDVDDINNTPIRRVNLHIYSLLPVANGDQPAPSSYNYIQFIDGNLKPIEPPYENPVVTVSFNGEEITARSTGITTFSNVVTLKFSDGQKRKDDGEFSYENLYTYSTYLSNDGLTWQDISLDYEGREIEGSGTYYILVKYDSESYLTDQFELFTLYMINSDTVSYYFHVDGKPVEARSEFSIEIEEDGKTVKYETVYLLNIDFEEKRKISNGQNSFIAFEDSRVRIEANEQLNTSFLDITSYIKTQNTMIIHIELYRYSSDITSKSAFAVVYIGSSTDILNQLYFEDAQGVENDLLQNDDVANPDDIVLPDLSRLKIAWNNYHAIPANKINVHVYKKYLNRYVEISPTVYTDGNVDYIYLSKAGRYQLSFEDSCSTPNYQLFEGSRYINIDYLSSVPFTITYTDPVSEQEVISEPINRAIFNSSVTLSLSDNSDLYHETPTIYVEKDGVEYTNYVADATNHTYTFSDAGYYEVKFIAQSVNLEDIRQETYIFSIINANESRFAFEYGDYSNYYIKKIIRNGQDWTDWFVQNIDSKKIYIKEDDKTYLKSLQTSYFDEKTGNGQDNKYIVTIATGDKEFANTTSNEFTFAFRINLAYPPLTVSLAQGGSTTKTIRVTYNTKSIYDLVGDCIIKIPGHEDIRVEAGNVNDALTTTEIRTIGTNYIQVYTMSGALLYSYRITRNEPLKPWTIIVIIVAVIAAAIIIFITVKLRKRLKVK